MTDANLESPVEPKETPLYGVGPVTVRELSLVAVWLVAFIVSFFSIFAIDRLGPVDGSVAVPGFSVWTIGITWVLTIGVPTVAVFLVVLRRFSPDGIRRVGSLGIDQFAAVAFSVSAVVWFAMLWEDIANGVDSGRLTYSWVVWVEFFLMLAGVILTVLAPFIPPFSADFQGRPDVVAHRNARPVRAVTARPRPEPAARPAYEPEAPEAYDATPPVYGAADEPVVQADPPAYETGETATFSDLGIDTPAASDDDSWSPPYARRGADSDAEPEAAPAVAQSPFWALAPEEREVHDERGVPIFSVGPTAWALVIEDRGAVYVIQHEDGRIGYLHDVSDIRRG